MQRGELLAEKHTIRMCFMNLQCLGHQHVHHKDPYSLHNSELQGIRHHLQQTSWQTVHQSPGFHLQTPECKTGNNGHIEVDYLVNGFKDWALFNLTFMHKVCQTW